MEKYLTKDKLVVKYVHDDGSETCFKNVSSCGNATLDGLTKEGDENSLCSAVERKKISLFASCSVGCRMNCAMCWLTMKRIPYSHLHWEDILNNVKEAFFDVYNHEFSEAMKDKYIKLCWMGMGEPLYNSRAMSKATQEILLMMTGGTENHVLGFDGVDIGTSFPKDYLGSWLHEVQFLNDYLSKSTSLKKNPNNIHDPNRSFVRIFISLHGAEDTIREKLIPRTNSIAKIIDAHKYLEKHNINCIFHYIMFDGINDSKNDMDNLIDLYRKHNLWNAELRILRYNKCSGSDFQESSKIKENVQYLLETEPKLKIKVQVSAGSEILASCGQFLLPNFV